MTYGLLAQNQLQKKKKNVSLQISNHNLHISPKVRFESFVDLYCSTLANNAPRIFSNGEVLE